MWQSFKDTIDVECNAFIPKKCNIFTSKNKVWTKRFSKDVKD